MTQPTVAFINLPWFALAPIPNHPGENYLRRGIRAGSRWPFSVTASAPPGAANVKLGEYLPAPIFMMSAAGYLQKARPDLNVIVRDSVARYESHAEFDEWWQQTAPEYVVLETGTPCWDNDLKFIRAMKHSNPAVKIAVYGPPARDLAASGDAPVDAWILGEPDRGVVRFVNGERGVIPFDLLSREELASPDMPFPVFDEDVAHHYADSNPKGAQWPELTVWASRGCPHVCAFCSFPATMTNDDPIGKGGRKIRFYSPKWLEEFIRHRIGVSAQAGHPIKAVRFDGDSENISDRHTKEICGVMRRVGLPWSMMCRADTSSREVWQEMKDSGCFGVKVGFESASDRIVNEVVGKKLDLKEAEETCRFLRSIGMAVHTTWMLGNPTETTEEMQLTLDTIKRFYAENVHSSHQLSAAGVITGTPLATNISSFNDTNFINDSDGIRKLETMLRNANGY